jgi:hypothetical protein
MGSRLRPAQKAENLTAICEPIAKKMWVPRLTTVLASMPYYKDSFTFYPTTKIIDNISLLKCYLSMLCEVKFGNDNPL